jgi:hypothetical protein
MEWNELLRGQRGETKRLMDVEGATGRYARIEMPLGVAKTNELIDIYGDYIGVVSITGDGSCKVRLDHRHAPQINLREVQEISSPFGKIYLETDGAGGMLTLYVGGALTARLKPIQSKVSIRTVAGTDVDLVPDKRFKSHTGGHLKVAVAVADTRVQVTATSKKVKWAIISVEEFNARWTFGNTCARATAIGQKVNVGGYIAIEYCDLSEIYFVNADAGAGELPVLQIEYVEEEV